MGVLQLAAPLKEESQVCRRSGVAPLGASPPRSFGAIEVARLIQQHTEVEGGVRIPSVLRPPICLRRTLLVPAPVEHDAEVESTRGVAGFIGAAVRELLGLGGRGQDLRGVEHPGLAPTLEQESEVCRRPRVPALDASAPGGLGPVEIAGLVEQHPQVESRVRVASLLSSPVGRGRACDVLAPVEQNTEIEGARRVTGSVGTTVRELGRLRGRPSRRRRFADALGTAEGASRSGGFVRIWPDRNRPPSARVSVTLRVHPARR